jgi:hypothetical protein
MKGVLVSLKAWTRDVEPYANLEEAWVQIRGVPPKWSNWRMSCQIASSLGKMVEINWNSLFSSFFRMVRIKIACKDVTTIPSKRLFEMRKDMYVVQFRVEGAIADCVEEDDGGDNDVQGDGEDPGMEEIDHDVVSEKDTQKNN